MCLTAGAGGVATAEVETKVGPGVGHRGGAVPEPHPLRRDRAAPHEVEREHRGRAQQPCKQRWLEFCWRRFQFASSAKKLTADSLKIYTMYEP